MVDNDVSSSKVSSVSSASWAPPIAPDSSEARIIVGENDGDPVTSVRMMTVSGNTFYRFVN